MKKKRQAKKTTLRHMRNRDRSRRGDKIDIVKWWVWGWGGLSPWSPQSTWKAVGKWDKRSLFFKSLKTRDLIETGDNQFCPFLLFQVLAKKSHLWEEKQLLVFLVLIVAKNQAKISSKSETNLKGRRCPVQGFNQRISTQHCSIETSPLGELCLFCRILIFCLSQVTSLRKKILRTLDILW